jgi:His-Xaa-Ser repeat protein HxsA
MKKVVNSLINLFAGFTVVSMQTSANELQNSNIDEKYNFLDEVESAELNSGQMPLYLANHRSHSSHASHGSHRSSAGSVRPTPSYPSTTPSEPLSKPPRPKSSVPSAEQLKFNEIMSDKDKRKNIILRVQLTLSAMGYYKGDLDGVMGSSTRLALNNYRRNKGLPTLDKLDLKVLNSLGVIVL